MVSYAGNGTVYAFDPKSTNDQITLLKPQPAEPRPGLTIVLPVDYWRNENDFLEAVSAKKPYQFVSLDGTTFLPAGADFVNGELYYGSKMHDVIRAFGLAPVPSAGQRIFVSEEDEQNTYSALGRLIRRFHGHQTLRASRWAKAWLSIQKEMSISPPARFTSYSPAGELIDTIDVPERPSQILFGGPDRSTLFILARSSLYAVRTRNKGR